MNSNIFFLTFAIVVSLCLYFITFVYDRDFKEKCYNRYIKLFGNKIKVKYYIYNNDKIKYITEEFRLNHKYCINQFFTTFKSNVEKRLGEILYFELNNKKVYIKGRY